MNRKLKNRLKNACNAQPNRKYSFIQQLQSDPTWRKLHPISSMIRISSASAFIFGTLATIAVGTGIIAYNFRSDDIQPTPDIPPIITETTSSVNTLTTSTKTLHSTSTTVQTTASTQTLHSTSVTTTQTTATSQTLHSDNTVSATYPTTYSATTVRTSSTTEITSASSSVYYTHLFKHDYTKEDLKNTSLDVLYGYPDRNVIEDIIRIKAEEKGTDFDEMMQEYNMTTADLSYGLLDFILSWNTPPIIEGKTTDIEYVAYDGKPWTICEITLTEVYNFKKDRVLNKGDKIKIAMAGGYMPVREYIGLNPDSTLFSNWTDEKINATVIYEDGASQREPKIDDVYTYVLNDNSDEVIPDFPVADCFTRQSVSDICQFTQNGDKFISTNTNYSDFYFTAEQLEKYSFKFDNVFKDPDSDRKIGIRNTSFLLGGFFECYSIEPDGRMTFLGECSTDDGFYPFDDENDYKITWTDNSIIIEYRFDYMSDYFQKEQFFYPKENSSSDSVYYVDNFRHPYESTPLDETVFGYIGYTNYFRSLYRKMFCPNSTNIDFNIETKNMSNHDITKAVMEKITDDSSTIVEGETTNLEYIIYDGKPWTICEITLTETYKSNGKRLKKGDKIKIAMAGGYMSARDFLNIYHGAYFADNWTDEKINSTMIYMDGSNSNEPHTGDIYTYFLDDAKKYVPDFPVDDCYMRQYFTSDALQFRKDNDKFVSCNNFVTDFYITSDEMQYYITK